ncbi:MAG: ATP-binding protein [Anaerolineales bacterium]|jgi:signal transduction histidine kinase
MNLLDPRTVLISYVISSLISMAVMASLWAQHRRRSSGLAYWLADFIMQFLGLLLIVLRGNLPDFFSIVLSNTFIIGGTLVLLIGLERYYEKSSWQWFNYIYLGLFFFIQMYFVYIQPSLQWRTINISVGILVMCGQSAWLLMQRVDPALQPGARPAVIAFGFFSLVSLVRIFVDLAVPQGTDVFKSGLYDTLGILIYQMLFIGLTYALVLMVNRRLNTALEDDISERKREEQALKGSEIRYRSLFENSPISLWEEDYSEVKRHLEKLKQQEITDLHAYFDGHPDVLIECANEIKVLDTNQATLALMRASSKDQLIGNLKAVIGLGASTAFVDELTSIADGRTEYHWEGDNYNLDGERISVSLRWMAAPGYEDTLERVLVSVLDVTAAREAEESIKNLNTELEQRVEKRTRELRDAQQKLLRQEKLAVLGQMAGSVGHELRNPLGVISNSVYYLKQVQPDANEKTKKYLDIIEQQVHTSDKIIGDLLGFARNTSVERQALVVSNLVQKVLERYPVPGTIKVKLELPAELPRVFVDPPQIEQVLGNLVVNACQAMKDGGDLAISAHQITPDTEQDQQQQMLKIEVKDAGTGISSENKQKLFEPLFTTKAGGIGLGLAVSKKLAEANGGRIEVKSQVGKGSTFTLYLPVKADK